MIEEINNSYILQGLEIGRAEGKVIAKTDAIIQLLRIRFNLYQVPGFIVDDLNRRTDLIALDSLFNLAAQCDSIDTFAKALK